MSTSALFILIVLSATSSFGGCEDFYSSVSGLESLLQLESNFLQSVEDYIDREFAKLQRIDGFLKDLEKDASGLMNTSGNNQVNVFKTFKRAIIDFNDVVRYISDKSNEKEYADNIQQLTAGEKSVNVMFTDLEGAALGLNRLQETYKLNTAELSNGSILGVQYGRPLGTVDCFYIADILKNYGQHKRAFEWLKAVWHKYQNEGDRDLIELMGEVKFLETLSYAAFQAGHIQEATVILKQAKQRQPEDPIIHINLKRLKMHLSLEFGGFQRHSFKVQEIPATDTVYLSTCRDEDLQTPTQQRPLRCMYSDNDVPYRKIGPFRVEQLNLEPLVLYYHEAIYDNEIEQVLELAGPNIARSRVGTRETMEVSQHRTSKNSWIDFKAHSFLANLKQRIVDMTRLSVETGEQLQVANYGIGGHYNAHFDFCSEPNIAYGVESGNRIATALFYISHVEAGGSTAFPRLKLNVKPIRRSMVFWHNLHNSTDPDFRMMHVGCPVIKGSKWILTEWLHERGQEFLRPCGLTSTAHLSAQYSV